MEVVGKFDFSASGEDELSFRKGDVLKILGTNDDWYKAEMHGHEGFVPKNYIEQNFPSWFQENASRNAAEEILKPCEPGAFLIRGSQSSPGDFSISVRHEFNVQHFKVMKDNKGHYFLWSEKFTSLNKMVEYYKTTSISRQTDILLRDGSRSEPAPPMQPQVKRASLPENKGPSHGGYGGPNTSAAIRRTSEPPSVQQHWRAVPEERAYTMGPMRASSSMGPVPIPRRSDTLPIVQRPSTRVRAKFDFTAEEDDELNFSAGDIIEVLDCSDPSWWMGQLQGRTGLIPSSYITPV